MADHVDDLIPSVDLQSADLSSDRAAQLLELFPEASSDGKVDFERLRALLGERVEEGRERFGLFWPGKAEAERLAYQRSVGTLLPCEDRSVSFGASGNVIIEGDNLEVLKLLSSSYVGKVDLIYIDPPYNTGSDFVYADDFKDTLSSYVSNYGENGSLLSTNTSADGRFHSNWLSMILPRIKIAHELLSDTGAIFISIDESEFSNLKSVLNEIFGLSNYIGEFVWSAGRKNNSKFISMSHDYVICYARNIERLKASDIVWRSRKEGLADVYTQVEQLKRVHGSDYDLISKNLKAWFTSLPESNPAKRNKHYSNVDERGVYFPSDISAPGGTGPKYEVLHPKTKKPVNVPSRGWGYKKERLHDLIAQNLVHFGDDENSVPCFKAYLKDRETEVPYSVFYQDGRAATKRLRSLMGGVDVFDHPKDELVLQNIIEFATRKDSIIIDFFAGSGTTAHAIMAQNAKDGGKRQFIIVQLPARVDPTTKTGKAALAAGYKTIADITRERVSRAAKQVRKADPLNPNLDLGFRYFRLAESNFIPYTPSDSPNAQLNFQPDNIREGRTDQHIVFQLMLTLKVPLSAKTEEKTLPGGTKSWHIADGELVVITNDLTLQALHALADELKALKTTRDLKGVVILDRCFAANADLKANARKIFEDADIPLKTV